MGRHEALVSQELFDRVQSILTARSARGQRQRKHHHYLKGALWCGPCHAAGQKSRMVLSNNTGRGGTYHYFVCTHKVTGTCPTSYVSREAIEEAVAARYQTIHFPDQLRSALKLRIEQTMADEHTTARELRAQSEREVAKLEVQEENLLDLAADGTVAAAKIRSRLRSIEERRHKLQADQATANTKLIQGARAVEAMLELLSDPEELYRRASDQDRRLLNQAIFEKIYVDLDEVIEDEIAEPFRDLVELARSHGEQAPAEVQKARIPPGGRRVQRRPCRVSGDSIPLARVPITGQWSGWRDLNPRPLRPERSALPS